MDRFRAFYYRNIKTLFLSRPFFTETSSSPFFILSAGRSGSTLLRKHLLKNTFVNIPPESGDLLPKLIKFYLRYNDKSWEYIVRNCVAIYHEEASVFLYWNARIEEDAIARIISLPVKEQSLNGIVNFLFTHYAQLHGFSFEKWGDKTPFLTQRLPWLTLLFPSSKFIFLIRDGRAVVNSLLKMNKEYTLETACYRWLRSIDAIKKHAQKISADQFIYVRYEDLVTHPEKELDKIYRFLHLSRRSNPLLEVFLGDDVLPYHNNIKLDISQASLKKWETELTKEEIDQITQLMNKELTILGYL